MEFNINNYRGKYAMHCKTEKEAESFCVYLNNLGEKWCDGDSYVEDNGWNAHQSNTCYIFNSGYRKPLREAINDGFTILEWSDFMSDTFTKAHLKNGDVVKLRNGAVYIVCVETGTLIGQNSYCNLSSFNTNLICKQNNEYDIVAVRRPTQPCHCQFSAFDYKDGKLVYERKEVEEMTIEEICKALGKDIKIVKKH